MFKPFQDVVSNVSETVLSFEKELGRPVIGVMPAYFPMELIWAAGGYPVQLWGNNLSIEKADAYMPSYCCSVARSVLELELKGIAHMVKAYAFTSLCDTLINSREIYRRLFTKPTLELSIPITRTKEARQTYLKSVIGQVVNGLEEITGNKINPELLEEASALYGHTRKLQRDLYRVRRENPGLIKNHDFYTVVKAAFFLPAQVYNDMLSRLLDDLKAAVAPDGNRPKILLTGMVFDPLEIYKIFDEIGADIVDDDYANGWRTVSKENLRVDDLTQGVTDFLFNYAPCCCLYNPDRDRHPYLVDKVKDSGAEGVIFWYTKFCEPDAFDRPQLINRLKKEGVPATTVELELSMTNFDSIKTRVSAFCEMLGD
jgi:bcr-type benzoyl-CoA reductase subunit C